MTTDEVGEQQQQDGRQAASRRCKTLRLKMNNKWLIPLRTAAEETTSIVTKDKLNDDNVSGILYWLRFLVLSTHQWLLVLQFRLQGTTEHRRLFGGDSEI